MLLTITHVTIKIFCLFGPFKIPSLWPIFQHIYLSSGSDLLTCGNELVSSGNDLLTCGNDLLTCGNDLLT